MGHLWMRFLQVLGREMLWPDVACDLSFLQVCAEEQKGENAWEMTQQWVDRHE